MDIVFEVLKWVVVILIAGFIGQFGKSLSLQVIDYFRKRKEKKSSPASPVVKPGEKDVSLSTHDKAKRKEEGAPSLREEGSTAEKTITPEAKEQNAKMVKKALKAQLKAQKKMQK